MKLSSLFILILVIIYSCKTQNNGEQKTEEAKIVDKEITLLVDSIAKDSSNTRAQASLYNYYKNNGNNDAQMQMLDKTLKTDSLSPFLLEEKAMVYLNKLDTANAIKYYEKVVSIPNYKLHDFALIALGTLYAGVSDKRAEEIGNNFIASKRPDLVKNGYYINGLSYTLKNDKKAAIGFFKKALIEDPSFEEGNLELALAYYDTKEFEKAIDVLNTALTLNNNFCDAYYRLGKCHNQLKNNDAAIASFEAAVACNPQDKESKDELFLLGVK